MLISHNKILPSIMHSTTSDTVLFIFLYLLVLICWTEATPSEEHSTNKGSLVNLQGCSWWDSEVNGYYGTPDTQPGVNRTDFILYVAALSTERCDFHRTVAFAAHCQQEKALDRY